MKLKRCKKCHVDLPMTTEFFHKNGDGFHPECKECRNNSRRKSNRSVTKLVDGKKECSKCHNFFPATIEFFHKSSQGILGLSAKCKQCRSIKKPKIEPKDGYKFCGKCSKELPMNERYFRKHKVFSTGFFSYCIQCEKEYKKKYRIQNIDKITMRDKEYSKLNAENKKEYDSIYRKQNKNRISNYLKTYYSMNKKQIFETQKKWRENNPNTHKEISRRSAQKRLAIKKKLPATFTNDQWNVCKKHFDESCAYCGSATKLEQDHFIPLSKGGEYTRDNIAVYYPPYYKPKWNGTEWIEGATQEYIDEMNKVEPTPPNQEERIDMLENMILLMMEGQ